MEYLRFWRRFLFLLLIDTPSSGEVLGDSDETRWGELKRQLIDRTSNITVVASLVTTASVSFMVASPLPFIMPWGYTFPYICLLGGGLSSALSVANGLGLIMFLNAVKLQTVKEMRTSRFAQACTHCRAVRNAILLAVTVAVWIRNSTFAKAAMVVGIVGLLGSILVIFTSFLTVLISEDNECSQQTS